MAKEAYYFSHDYGARNDPKLQKVLMKLGQQGKGVYWDLIEMLFEEGGKLLLSECESYAFALRVDLKIIQSLINDFELFEKNDIYFWSNSVLKRLEIRENKSIKASENARKRWDRANAMQSHSKRNAIKEKKGKEKKVNIKELFNSFYSLYPRKEEKQKALESFEKALKKTNIETLMTGLNNYLKHIKVTNIERQFIKLPATWLNQGCWNDEYETNNSVSKSVQRIRELEAMGNV
jgi:hypothetical protein